MDNRDIYIKEQVSNLIDVAENLSHKDIVRKIQYILDTSSDHVRCWNCENFNGSSLAAYEWRQGIAAYTCPDFKFKKTRS